MRHERHRLGYGSMLLGMGEGHVQIQTEIQNVDGRQVPPAPSALALRGGAEPGLNEQLEDTTSIPTQRRSTGTKA